MPGSLTTFYGFLSLLFVHGFPETARFLSEKERKFVLHRLRSDGQLPAQEDFKWRSVRKAVQDYKTLLSAVFLIGMKTFSEHHRGRRALTSERAYVSGTGVPIYSFGGVLIPIIAVLGAQRWLYRIYSLTPEVGHTGTALNLLFVPSFLTAGIFVVAFGYASDRFGRRGYFCM